MRKSLFLIGLAALSLTACDRAPQEAADLKLNDLGYFETRGVNVLVFSNTFSGGFNDEKNSGIEIIHHGVRTIQGGAVRLRMFPPSSVHIFQAGSPAIRRDESECQAGTSNHFGGLISGAMVIDSAAISEVYVPGIGGTAIISRRPIVGLRHVGAARGTY